MLRFSGVLTQVVLRGLLAVMTSCLMLACVRPQRASPITTDELAELGCYHLAIDYAIGYPAFPTSLRIGLDSSAFNEGRRLSVFPGPAGFEPTHWTLSGDSLSLHFEVGSLGQEVVVILRASDDGLDGMAFATHTGVPGLWRWRSKAHAFRAGCPSR